MAALDEMVEGATESAGLIFGVARQFLLDRKPARELPPVPPERLRQKVEQLRKDLADWRGLFARAGNPPSLAPGTRVLCVEPGSWCHLRLGRVEGAQDGDLSGVPGYRVRVDDWSPGQISGYTVLEPHRLVVVQDGEPAGTHGP